MAIRFSTNLVSFYNTAFWGLAEEVPYPEWLAAFAHDPRRYFERMFDLTKEAGLEAVELGPNPAGWESALTAFGSAQGLADSLAQRGLVLSSSYAHGRQLIGNAMDDPAAIPVADDAFRRHAQFLNEIGTQFGGAATIVSGNVPRSRFGNASPDDTATAEDFTRPVERELHEQFAEHLNRLGAIVAPYGVRIAIHTDAYSMCVRREDIATVMELTDPASIFLCPDAGHITLDGGTAVDILRDNIDRIPTMHWKDCAAPLSGHVLRGDQKERHSVMLTYFRVLGSGTIDWAAWMNILKEHGWKGWATEEIDNSPDPVGELRQGLEYFRTHLAPIYS